MPILFNKLLRAEPVSTHHDVQVVKLVYHERQRNRLAVMLSNGQAAAIVLPRGQLLQAGDVLISSDGRKLRIEAAIEQLMRISANTNLLLMRVIYHLANRHVRAMISEHAVFIEPDPVLERMVRQLGGRVEIVQQVFEPEAGAYSGGHHHHGEQEKSDLAMGTIGEMLSIAAHQDKCHDAGR